MTLSGKPYTWTRVHITQKVHAQPAFLPLIKIVKKINSCQPKTAKVIFTSILKNGEANIQQKLGKSCILTCLNRLA